jgi:PAS domain S-box-containing protein
MNRFFLAHPEVFHLLHDSVIATDLEGTVLDCNEACEKIYGYSPDEFIGRSVAVLYPPSQVPKMKSLMETVMARGRADGEFLNLTKDGREIWIQLSVSLLQDAEGKPYGMMGFSIDITEQKSVELARREADELGRAARAAAGVGVWHLDFKKKEVGWDEQSSLLLGLPPNAKPSLALFLSCIHPEDRAHVHGLLSEPMPPDSQYAGEYRVTDEDGSTRYLLSRGRTFYDDAGRPDRMVGVSSDITPRKRAEEELRRAEAKYRVFFDSPFVGVASGNLERITDANDTFCKLLGYKREDLTSGAVRWQDVTPSEYLTKDYALLQEMLEKGTGTPIEKEYIRGDGSRIRVILGSSLVSREPIEWSCFILDITQQHRALAALRSGEQMAAAARLGSSLAHEINNPLASLTNIVYLLRNGKGAGSDDLLIAAQEALERVTRITRQMIGIYSERETAAEFDIGNVLEDTLASYSARTRAKNVRIAKRNELLHGTFLGVEPEFRRMLSSLLENAVEHARPGGLVNVRLYHGREWGTKQRSGIKVFISDNGPGIASTQLANLFEPFQSTKARKGSGLGLWTCRGIAEKHGGSVRVRSSTREGKSGTAVMVFLPETPAGMSHRSH